MPIVHCRYGEFSIPDHSDLIFNAMRQYGEWGQHEIDVLARLIHLGGNVVDAGAFMGTHARAFSQMVGEEGMVHAFEPNPASYRLLLENSRLAHYSNIATYQIALGERQATSTLLLAQSEENLGGTMLSDSATDPNGIEISIQCLDDFDFGKINFIKADLEGMEYPMLLGAEKTITRDRPIVFLEVNDLEASHPILGWASDRDYVVLGVVSGAFNPGNYNGLDENMFGGARECSLLLIHKDEWAAKQATLAALNCLVIDTLDDLALLLLCKPQYVGYLLENKSAANLLQIKHLSEVERLQAQLAATENAKAKAETLAISRLAELGVLTKQLEFTEQVKAVAEELAHSHLSEVERLQAQLTATEDAKTKAEMLAISRLAERDVLARHLEHTEQAKTFAEKRAHSHLSEVEGLHAKLASTENTKSKAETLAISQQEELGQIRSQLVEAKNVLEKIQNELNVSNSCIDEIRTSLGYKLLTALRLTPKKRRGLDG